MTGFKERVVNFLQEGLTTTPEQRAFIAMAPGGLTCTGPIMAEIGNQSQKRKEVINMTNQEALREHLDVIMDDQSHPLKRHEDNQFAKSILRAERAFEAHGVPMEMLPLLVRRETLKLVSADATWEGGESADRANKALTERLDQLNTQMVELVRKHGIKPDVCQSLGIKMA